MERDSLGLIETSGLVAAIEAADAGSKAANVIFRGYERARAGLITVVFLGDVAAVRAAVTAGAAAAKRVGTVISVHVIARPDKQLRAFAGNGSRPLSGKIARAVAPLEEPRPTPSSILVATAEVEVLPAPASLQTAMPSTEAVESQAGGESAGANLEEAPPETLKETEEKFEAALDELTPEEARALDEQVESVVAESECAGGSEVSFEEPEVVSSSVSARKKEAGKPKEKLRKPRSKRKA